MGRSNNRTMRISRVGVVPMSHLLPCFSYGLCGDSNPKKCKTNQTLLIRYLRPLLIKNKMIDSPILIGSFRVILQVRPEYIFRGQPEPPNILVPCNSICTVEAKGYEWRIPILSWYKLHLRFRAQTLSEVITR